MTTPTFKNLERAYGFDDVAIVPGDLTVNPDQTNLTLKVGQHTFLLPIVAAAMDGVVNPAFAVLFGQLGGLAVLNLEGVQTRYDEPGEVLEEIISAPQNKVTQLLQKVYSEPIKTNLIGERIQTIKKGGVPCAASVTPASAKALSPVAKEAGLDILVVQSTVTTARHTSKSYKGLVFSDLKQAIGLPIMVGNCVTYSACLEIMRTGIDGILVGVGPGAACTTRDVLGVGVPQVTATMDCAAARETYFKETGKYINIITDGGMRIGGDMCKAFASGADAVMLGSVFARAQESPGKGFHWGMANPHATLPRGTRVGVGPTVPLRKILFGPTSMTDGTENFVGALRTSMGVCSALTIQDMHKAKLVIAPSIKTEGKHFQSLQCA